MMANNSFLVTTARSPETNGYLLGKSNQSESNKSLPAKTCVKRLWVVIPILGKDFVTRVFVKVDFNDHLVEEFVP